MRDALILWLLFLIGYVVRALQERGWRQRRRGGYVRRVPMSSVHPREPKS